MCVPVGADETLFRKMLDGGEIEIRLDISESDDHQFTATVAFNDHSPFFKSSGQSAADATHILGF